MRPRYKHAGFSLIEMIIVISVTAIVGAMVATFLKIPIDGYLAQDRRSRLTDTADTALRRVAQDVRLALPNSVRVTTAGGVTYLEFLITRAGGRYRAEGGGDVLDFSTADSSFDVLGPAIAMQAGDRIAVYNLGIPGADAWLGETLAAYSGAGGTLTTIPFAPAKLFPVASPGNRFQVVEGPVTYACDLVAGTLTRYWGYGIADPQPTPPAAPASSAMLANRVSDCTFTYLPGITERGGLISMTLALTLNNETVRLHSNTQVSNQP